MNIKRKFKSSQTLNNLIYAFNSDSRLNKKLFFVAIILGIFVALFDGIVLISLSKILGATSSLVKGSETTQILNNILYPKFMESLIGKKYLYLFYLGFYTIFLFILKTIWLRISCAVMSRMADKINQRAFESVLWQDFNLCQTRVNTTILSEFSLITLATNGVILPIIDAVGSLASVLTISLVIFMNSRFIGAGIMFVLFLFYFIVIISVRKRIKILSDIYRKSKADSVNIQQIGIETYRNIILSGEADWLKKIFSQKSKNITSISGKILFFGRFPRIVIDLILFGGVVIILASSKFLEVNLNLGFFTFLVLALVRLVPPLQAVYRNLTNIRSNIFALDALINLSKNKSKRLTKRQFPKSMPNNDIDIRNVSFSFSKDINSQILKGINMKIKKNQHTGIIGNSGSGKSTLLDLIIGYIKPTEGELLVGAENINQSKKINRKWLNSTYLVSQNELIFNGSFLENIVFSDIESNYSRALLEKAIHYSELEEVLNNLPNGLNTLLGSGGFLLSGGQKQRISLARAIYKSRPYLFLDEATSALDSETEKKVLLNINSLLNESTVVSISHKKSSLDFCNKIWNLKNGKIKNIK